MNTSRFIVGLGLIGAAMSLFLFDKGNSSTAGAVGLGILGLVSITISRKQRSM
jgi:multisubunit Na+/H+ antiporter MnhC subunit